MSFVLSCYVWYKEIEKEYTNYNISNYGTYSFYFIMRFCFSGLSVGFFYEVAEPVF